MNSVIPRFFTVGDWFPHCEGVTDGEEHLQSGSFTLLAGGIFVNGASLLSKVKY
jgi:hypothetical protein